MTRVAILGATGYTALELLKLLARHPHVEIAALTSRQEGGPPISAVHPALARRVELRCEDIGPDQVAERAECAFVCLPHGQAAGVVPRLLERGMRVVDLSADYRLTRADSYAAWYEHEHPDPARLGDTPYGLPELFREAIPTAPLVANPGCYPTSALLPLAPLLAAGWIEPEGIIIDSKSGVSGAGRTPNLTTHFPECNESVSAYNVGQHRHTPEIEQTLERYTGRAATVVFTPHLIPMDRGILSTIYARPRGAADAETLLGKLAEFYAEEPFVRVGHRLPATKDTAHTNFCDITVRVVRGHVLVVSCLDNLIKGASGAAVQNFNLMFGHPETTALQ